MSSGWELRSQVPRHQPRREVATKASRCEKDHISSANNNDDSHSSKYCHLLSLLGLRDAKPRWIRSYQVSYAFDSTNT